MKTFLPLFCMAVVAVGACCAPVEAQQYFGPQAQGMQFSGAQFPGAQYPGAQFPGAFPGAQASFQDGAVLPDAGVIGNTTGTGGGGHFMTAFATTFPGRAWLSYTGVNNGLGFGTGGYFTLGGKMRLGEDLLNGRWLVEVRGHLAHEQGQVFTNIGVERVFTLKPAKADIGVSFWFDADGDRERRFGHNFQQLGVGGYIRHERYTIAVNGYVPVGTTGFVQGLNNCFLGNNIIIQNGIDSALQGADFELRLQPWKTAMWQGSLHLGGYYYEDEDRGATGIDPLAGVRVRVGVQTLRGCRFDMEYNYDDNFKDTIFGRITLSTAVFGDYDPTGRDLNPTIRNDHVVVYHQDTILAIDPDTGLPYNVIHVDNEAAPGGNGTFEAPFDALADADPLQGGASAPDDIIFVREGDGTFTNYDTGITLQTGQLLLGDGFEHPIPLAGGGVFILCNDIDGDKPIITNTTADLVDIVTLADRNTVAAFTIEGDHGVNANRVANGIFGALAPTETIIRDNMIQNIEGDAVLGVGDGVHLVIAGGTISIVDNIFTNIGDDAVEIETIIGTTLTVTGNELDGTGATTGTAGHGFDIGSGGGLDGEETVVVTSNTFAGIGGHGFFLHDLLDGDGGVLGVGSTFLVADNTVTGAGGNGFFFLDIDDPLNTFMFLGNTISGALDGIRLERFDGSTFLFDVSATEVDVNGDPIPNNTSNNVGNGLAIIDYANTAAPFGMVGDFDILTHTATDNVLSGLLISRVDADFLIDSGTFTNNIGNGAFFDNLLTTDSSADLTMTGNSFTDNNAGATAGIRINLDDTFVPGAIASYDFTGNTIQNNNLGVISTVSGAADLTVNIVDFGQADPGVVDDFTGHDLDTISFMAVAGGTGELNVTNSILDANALLAGAVIRLSVDDATLTANVSDNSITGIGDQAVVATVTGDSNTDFTFDNNTIDGGVGDNMSFTYDLSNTDVQSLAVTNSSLSNAGINGISIDVDGTTRLDADIVQNSNTITDPGERGFELIMGDDSRVRLDFLANNLIDTAATSATHDGVFVQTNDTSELMANFVGNVITNFGGNGDIDISAAGGDADPDWGQGMNITANDFSEIGVRVDNNAISASGLEGLRIQANDAADIIALVENNFFLANDVTFAEDTDFPPGSGNTVTTKALSRFDFLARTTSPGADIDLALNNNLATLPIAAGEDGFFELVGGFPVGPIPGSGLGTMTLEFNGGANDPDPSFGIPAGVFGPENAADVPGTFIDTPTTINAFGTSVETDLDAFDAGFDVP